MFLEMLYRSYKLNSKRLRKLIMSIVKAADGGEMYSQTLRRIMRDYHDVSIGMYSYGSCFRPENMCDKTSIGRYCSFANGVCMFSRNHPIKFKSTHPFFYSRKLGVVDEDKVLHRSIEIGNDVWVGYNAMIMPSVTRIGDGAVIGAGAVVTKNVPDFAVVVGVPASIVKYRFPPEIQQEIKESRWWDKDIEELRESIDEFYHPIEEAVIS